jgi:hypothetical protein
LCSVLFELCGRNFGLEELLLRGAKKILNHYVGKSWKNKAPSKASDPPTPSTLNYDISSFFLFLDPDLSGSKYTGGK